MLHGIQVKNSLAIQLGKEHEKNNLLGDWLGAMAHMSSKVLEEFPPCSGGGKQKSKDFAQPRRIS